MITKLPTINTHDYFQKNQTKKKKQIKDSEVGNKRERSAS